MVYCGKASQGCQNCRTRRIKCDKIKPECSQCVRVFKKCPGYRDQLSLMFRDESSKVIQKAHAQWGGVPENPDGTGQKFMASSSTHSLSLGAPSTPSSPSSTQSSPKGTPAITLPPPQQTSVMTASNLPPGRRASSNDGFLSFQIGPTLQEQGIQFYVDRYLLGHPDEPRSAQELSSSGWLWHPALQDVMAAVGLAGLSNLTGNPDMMVTARQRYGMALRQTGKLIQPSNPPSLEVTMRLVVMLAMFEVVKGTHRSTSTVHAHIMGGAALLRSWCPIPRAPFGGFRGFLQLCYSMFIPFHEAGTTVPPVFFDWIAFTAKLQDPTDEPSTDLALTVAQFVQISAFVKGHVLTDGRPKTASVIRQLLDLDVDMANWESDVQGKWVFSREKNEKLPAKAIFMGEYHIYFDVWTARVWNHYRWARILVNQLILDLANQNPISSLPLVSAARRSRILETIRELAKDTLISTPSHWRHPALEESAQITVRSHGGGGSGAAGLPALLFHLKVASCAPGIPIEYWEWALGIIQCIWGDMGMLHARSMVEAMRAYHDTLQRTGAEGILSDD